MSDRIKGSALTLGGAACWGVSGCMGQYLFTREGMDSTWLVLIRLFLAGLILCGFFFIKDRKTLFDPWNVRKNPRNAIDLLVYGLAGVSCCQFTYFLTIQLSSAGMGTILHHRRFVHTVLKRRGDSVHNLFAHTRCRDQIQRFHDAAVIFFRQQHGIAVLGGDVDGLVVFNGLLYIVEGILTEIRDICSGHRRITPFVYSIAYAYENVNMRPAIET